MTKLARTEPWRALPASVADTIEPELGAITEGILASIAREVPEYARPLEGSFGRGVRTGVTEALRQFVGVIREPGAGRERGVYVALGRGELRQGRTLDALQAAYRVGARVAWRHVAAAARRAEVDPETLSTLAEAIFAYIDELSADSVEGYAQAQSELEGERQRVRAELAALLVSEPPIADAVARDAARDAGWPLPRRVAALACREDDRGRIARRLSSDPLVASVDGTGCVLIPDPDGPGRPAEIARAVERAGGAALGPTVAPTDLAGSWSLARAGLDAVIAGTLDAGEPVRAEDHLAQLLVAANGRLLDHIAARRLGPLDALTPKARRRLEETALAYVQHQGNAAAMARAMHVHPQTARYRLARLRGLLGDELDDPDARFEIEAGLRARGVRLSAAAA
ncbi:MAG TPA: helix-turn-helix domain-containing protein [Thermoleophilaceae bacterium]